MNYHDREMKQVGIFAKVLDLDVFNALLALTAKMSETPDAMMSYNYFIQQRSLWGELCKEPESYFTQYGLRYVGEITERFEERIGSSLEVFRAVALALGFALPFLNDSMFIGAQRQNFLHRLKQEAGDDLYLLGAKYLLTTEPAERRKLRAQLAGVAYTRTEEAMFVLSLLDENEDEFVQMRPQIARLWGNDRTIPLFGNIRLLDWLLRIYKPAIVPCRKKDNAVLRALLKLPSQFFRENSAAYMTLVGAGYSDLEIRYANTWMIWPSWHPDRIDSFGIPSERAATQFCIAALNQEEELPAEAISHMEQLFNMHRKFAIRYEGNEGIWNAVAPKVKPANPKTVLWMILDARLMFSHHFNVFDPKWDILAQQLRPQVYEELFIAQMEHLDATDPTEIRRYMDRYQELTGQDFMSVFHTRSGWYIKNFKLLVEAGIIDLWSFFHAHLPQGLEQKARDRELNYIQSYVAGSYTREAFDFNRKLLDSHDMTDLPELFDDSRDFHMDYIDSFYSPYGGACRLRFRRDFLTEDEQRQLFEWIDTSVFRFNPHRYYTFVEIALQSQDVRDLYGRDTLRQMLKALIATHHDIQHVEYLKRELFTQEELETDMAEKKAEQERIKQERLAASLESKRKDLERKFDGTLQSLSKYVQGYYISQDKKEALSLIIEPLSQAVSKISYPAQSEQVAALLNLCGSAILFDTVSREKIYTIMENVIREERANAANDGTYTDPGQNQCLRAGREDYALLQHQNPAISL